MDKVIAEVFHNEIKVGELWRDRQRYQFKYDNDFLNSPEAFPLCFNFPLKSGTYESNSLFPYFEGLVSEGWLLKVQSRTQKIDERDYFSMLLENGEDLIGGTRVIKKDKK